MVQFMVQFMVMQARCSFIRQQMDITMMLVRERGLTLADARAQVSAAFPMPDFIAIEQDLRGREERAEELQRERHDLPAVQRNNRKGKRRRSRPTSASEPRAMRGALYPWML